jgi:hypothetical protein
MPVRPTPLADHYRTYDPVRGWVYPGQREAHDPALTTILDAAERFWAQRNVRPAHPVRLYVADTLRDTDNARSLGQAMGRGEDGQVILDARWAGANLARLRSARPRAQARAVRSLYEILAHETGHASGLEHAAGGIMDATGDVVPGDWTAVARRLGVTRFPRLTMRAPRGGGVGRG